MRQFSQVQQRADNPAVFVVHGIGKQRWGETAAQLYGGFEDVIKIIGEWQQNNLETGQRVPLSRPSIQEGYWADYDDPKKFFEGDWAACSDYEKAFYKELYSHRVVSAGYTYKWFVKQIFRLWNPWAVIKMMAGGSVLAWPLYILMAPFSLLVLTAVRFRKSELLGDFLNDIRLYVDPRGTIEENIVAGINKMVASGLLQLMGLKPDFTPLPREEWVTVMGVPRRFERIVLVAHSLGTVISYNVIADLVERADKLLREGTEEQKAGVERFRKSLARFVTLGSPLDKVAVLFGERAVRPWPKVPREEFFHNTDTVTSLWFFKEQEWWINFYHVLDPVSGSLGSDLICGDDPPSSFHARSGLIPGVAHGTYWKDTATLRFILSRAYGREELADRPLTPLPVWLLTAMAGSSYLLWAVLMLAAMAVIVVWGWSLGNETLHKILEILWPGSAA